MVAQIITLSSYEIFKKLKTEYKMPESVYYPGLLAFELRQIEPGLVDVNVFTDDVHIYFNFDDNSKLKMISLGTIYDFKLLEQKYFFDSKLKGLVHSCINNFSHYDELKYFLGNKKYLMNELLLMGIINITPDSFSDGGRYFNPENAFKLAEEMITKGIDIIDIGGESSRPGSEFISADEEIRRIIPVIKSIKERFPQSIISVDTTKSKVASHALEAGAQIVNDISGATFDENMFGVVREYDASIVIMHIKGIPKNMQQSPAYKNLVREVYDFLWHQSNKAKQHGIESVIIDPGIGFGKNIEHNLELIKRLSDFKSMGFPILFGSSRKSYLGRITGLDVSERDIVSVISDSFAVNSGARIIRTHNVQYGLQLKKFYKAAIN